MRTTRLMLPWSAIVLISGAGAGCATLPAGRTASEDLRADAALVRTTPEERRSLRDSAFAQAVADEVGPRVSVTADFDYAGGSRRVDARFHMYDDAYVIVGHLDASGRLKVVFPSEPGDDGFVRGDKIYQVPSFFAGFADDYSWRYSQYRYQPHSVASRLDSYDAGLGYVFVIASWRPMRLDRITDGNRWLNYDISDISYMQDPREAIEELGSVIAGDNRESYTIQYARYTTTNYGTYSLASFDAINGGCRRYGSSLGWGLFGPLSFTPYGYFDSFGYGPGSYCGSGYALWYTVGRPFGYPTVGYAPSPAPIIPRGRPTVPIGGPVFHSPKAGDGTVALHRPRGETVPTTPTSGTTIFSNGSTYHRPGLIAEDAAGPRGRGTARPGSAEAGFTSNRPTIQQMIGTRRIEQEARGMGVRDAGMRDEGARSAGVRDNSWSSTNRGGVSAPRNVETGGRWSDGGGSRAAPRESGRTYGGESRTYAAPRGEPRGESARMAPAHSEPAHAAPAHSEPARSAPPASSSSSGSQSQKKP
jgi:hypothetical protein